MVSAASIVRRVGVGGRVAVYMKAVALYFAVSAATAPPARAAPPLLEVAAKCAPIGCLLALLALHRDADEVRARYRRRVALGLAFSVAGDALLVWSDTEFVVGGLVAFAAAQCAYVSALGWRPPLAWAAPPLYAGALAFTTLVLRPAGVLRVLTPLYGLLLGTMSWRALARGGLAAAGGLAFVVSDSLLGYDMFVGPLPHRTLLVMSSYYAAQLLLALSALPAPAPAPAPPRARCPAPCTADCGSAATHLLSGSKQNPRTWR